MGLTRINNNIAAINANRNLTQTSSDLRVSLERLSSGLRINRAADDAAGLSISENLRAQVNGLNRAIDNASDSINLVNTAEGALIETTARLQRIRVLAVQAANTGTNDANALAAIQDEIETGIAEITRIGNDTQFGTRRLINGDNSNNVGIVDGATTGLSLATGPTSSTLSTGTRFLRVEQTVTGSQTLVNGTDGVNNTGASGFSGATFDTGTYELALSNVRAAADRVVEANFTIANGGTPPAVGDNVLGETVDDGDGNTFTLGTGDVLTFTGTESDGNTFTATITLATAGATITNVLTALNTALGTDTATYDTANGIFVITAAVGGSAGSPLAVSFTVDDNGGGGANEFSTGQNVRTAGNDNDGILSIGGTAVQVTAGDTVTLSGPAPANPDDPTPQITLTLGGTITEGTDLLQIVASEFEGSLEGGQTVTFQNGDQNVRFRSGTTGGFASGETVTLNFDATVDLGGGTNRTFALSAVNNALNFQIGANQGQRVSIAFGDLRASNLGFVGDTQPNGNDRTVAGINVTSLTGANEAISIIDEALNQVNQQRSALGAFTNRLEATIANLGVASENLTASESRIRDADIALETTRFTRNQILLQSGISILAQANLAPQSVLSLLG
jgi:flagellin